VSERIRLLLSQAGIHYEVLPKDTVYEKFAELIVKECALTAGLMEHEGRTGIGAQILDNFGVEE
jgi:hypothetical protein